PGLTWWIACSVTPSSKDTSSMDSILPSRYTCMYTGAIWVVAGLSALAAASLTLRWTVELWTTSPLDGERMVSLAGLAGRGEGAAGVLAAGPPPPHAAADTTTSTAARQSFADLIASPQTGSRDHHEADRGRDRWAEGTVVDGHELGLEAMAVRVGVDGRRGPVRHRDKNPIQIEMDVPLVRDQMGGCPGHDARSDQAEPDPDGGRIAPQHLLGSRGEDHDARGRRGTHRRDLDPEHGGNDERQHQGRRGHHRQRPAGNPWAPKKARIPDPERGPGAPET